MTHRIVPGPTRLLEAHVGTRRQHASHPRNVAPHLTLLVEIQSNAIPNRLIKTHGAIVRLRRQSETTIQDGFNHFLAQRHFGVRVRLASRTPRRKGENDAAMQQILTAHTTKGEIAIRITMRVRLHDLRNFIPRQQHATQHKRMHDLNDGQNSRQRRHLEQM